MPAPDERQFDLLLSRIRGGDEQAAAEFLKLYEPQLRREIRLRLTNAGMRRTLDSTDVCQSVLGNFFVRLALGELNFDRPEDLLRLLSRMARNKLIDRHRRHQVRMPAGQQAMANVADVEPADNRSESPSKLVAADELLEKINGVLTAEELQIADLRRAGYSWQEVSDQLGQSPEALRKRLARARNRLEKEMDLD